MPEATKKVIKALNAEFSKYMADISTAYHNGSYIQSKSRLKNSAIESNWVRMSPNQALDFIHYEYRKQGNIVEIYKGVYLNKEGRFEVGMNLGSADQCSANILKDMRLQGVVKFSLLDDRVVDVVYTAEEAHHLKPD